MTLNNIAPSEEQIEDAAMRSRIKAEEYLRDPEKSRALVENAYKKAQKNEVKDPTQADFWGKIKAFIRMLKAYRLREYTVVPWASIAWIAGAVLYFLTPLDLILDWLPVIGFVDDTAVLVFVFGQVNKDVAKFQKWEAAQSLPSEQIIDI